MDSGSRSGDPLAAPSCPAPAFLCHDATTCLPDNKVTLEHNKSSLSSFSSVFITSVLTHLTLTRFATASKIVPCTRLVSGVRTRKDVKRQRALEKARIGKVMILEVRKN